MSNEPHRVAEGCASVIGEHVSVQVHPQAGGKKAITCPDSAIHNTAGDSRIVIRNLMSVGLTLYIHLVV